MSPSTRGRHVVVAGASGGAVLHDLLAGRRFERVTLLTTRRFLRTPSGVDHAVLDAGAWADGLPAADHAVLLFGALRREREALYWHPERADLVRLATALRRKGVRSLALVLSPGIEPLSGAERRLIDQLGFTPPGGPEHNASPWVPATASWPTRLAAWMIRTVLTSMQQVSAPRPRARRTRTASRAR